MMFRIQKLLMYEYDDFEETVLVESPFAQVSETGKGIRQVQIALTPTKLVMGVDSFDKTSSLNLSNVYYMKQDPETECMELISLLPLDFLYIKIFRKGQRQLMKVVAVGGFKVMLFEFGGHLFKNLYWNVWRDRIAALRTNQNRYFCRAVPSTSSSSERGGQPLEVVAEIHDEASVQNEEILDLGKLCESTKLISSSKNTLGPGNCFAKNSLKSSTKTKGSGTLTSPFTDRNHFALQEVAQYFLDTQSEIIVRSTEREICDGNCMNAQLRSASLGNVYSCMSAGW